MNNEKKLENIKINIETSFYNACELFLERCKPNYEPSPKPKEGGGGSSSRRTTPTPETLETPDAPVTIPTPQEAVVKPVKSVSTQYNSGVRRNEAVFLARGQTAKQIYGQLDVVTGDADFTDDLIFSESKEEGKSLMGHALLSLKNIFDSDSKEFENTGNGYKLTSDSIPFTFRSNDGSVTHEVDYIISVIIPNDSSHENAEFRLKISKGDFDATIPFKMKKIVKDFIINREN